MLNLIGKILCTAAHHWGLGPANESWSESFTSVTEKKSPSVIDAISQILVTRNSVANFLVIFRIQSSVTSYRTLFSKKHKRRLSFEFPNIYTKVKHFATFPQAFNVENILPK